MKFFGNQIPNSWNENFLHVLDKKRRLIVGKKMIWLIDCFKYGCCYKFAIVCILAGFNLL